MSKREVANLLGTHTTIASWGKPCISRLARLMGTTAPRSVSAKASLIRKARNYIGGGK